ncbi:NAD(P)-binding protein [Methanomassiliicoccales archaeon LGM-DZ1]|nr:NAD(P)-binding protein [Methanomassiliicoccales archaeon LGM-DZ1]
MDKEIGRPMSGRRYLVVGAGISGSTIARLMAGREPDSSITVIDSSDRIAGACSDRIQDGIDVQDLGPHILHTDDAEVWGFLSRFTDFNAYLHRVKGIIGGSEVPLPFNTDSLRICFPPTAAGEIEKKLVNAYGVGARVPVDELKKSDDRDIRTLAAFLERRCTPDGGGQVPAGLCGAADRGIVIVSREPGCYGEKYQGVPVGAFNNTRRGTVLGGYSAMVRNMLDMPNVKVCLGTPFDPDSADDYDRIFYTGSADGLLDYRFGRLPYRSRRFVFETHLREHVLDNAVIEYPENYDFERIHEFKYYLGTKTQTTMTAKEYPDEYVPGKNEPCFTIPSAESVALHRKYAEAAASEFPNLKLLGRLGDYRDYSIGEAVSRSISVFREEFGPELPEIRNHKSSRTAGSKTPTVMYLGY